MNIPKTLWILALSGLGLVALSWMFLPDYLPLVWNLLGEPELFVPRWAAWIPPLLPVLALGLLRWWPPVPPQKTAASTQTVFRLIGSLFTLTQSVLVLSLLGSWLGLSVWWLHGFRALFGLVCLIGAPWWSRRPFGSAWGLRLSWTLASPEVWDRTHRWASWASFGLGLWTWITLLAPPVLDGWLFGAGLMAAVLVVLWRAWDSARQQTPSPESQA